MTIYARPAALRDSIAVGESGNLTIDLAATELPRHMVIIPRDVLAAVFGPHDDPVRVGHDNFLAVEKAIGRAWDPDRLREIVGVFHPGHIIQLWLDAGDFKSL